MRRDGKSYLLNMVAGFSEPDGEKTGPFKVKIV